MLGKQKNARLAFFRSGAVAEPRRQWNTRSIFRSDAAHIQHDCAEAAGLQQQVCHAQRLLKTRPGFSWDNRLSVRSQSPRRIGFEELSLGLYPALRLRTSGRCYFHPQKTTDCIGEPFDLIARMRTEAAAVHPLLDSRREEVFFRQPKTLTFAWRCAR